MSGPLSRSFVRFPGLATAFGALAIAFGGIAGGASAMAQDPGQTAAQTPPPVARATGAGPALWVIRDEDSTLYLFGTVHLLRPGTAWGTDQVDAAFASADELWLEIANIDDEAAATPLFIAHGVSPQRPLSARMSPEQWALMDQEARAMGLSGAQLDPMRPWLAGLTLSLTPLARAGYTPQDGVELSLLQRARTAGKTVRGLETYESQVAMFAGFPEPVELQFLLMSIEDAADATELMNTMTAAWATGDVETVERLVVTEMKASAPEVYDAILTRRNTDWANQIQALLDGSGTTFIAVGAGHLAGPDSVQAILESRGVQVNRQ